MAPNKSIGFVLNDLVNDGRLARLFSTPGRPCALQLWILQIKSDQLIQNRLVYGRLLPYNHSSDCWSSSEDDDFQAFGQVRAQIIRLNLYVESVRCIEILRRLTVGQTIAEISKEMRLGLSGKFKARFGAAVLAPDELVYRPVAYLFNRDAHDRRSPSSPHDGAGAYSASITQSRKGELFRLGHGYDIALTALVVERLNADTGLDFGGTDTARFGDLELLVFPALDDYERNMLSVNWVDSSCAFVARFNPMQVPCFSGFQFRLSIANDGQIVYSAISIAERDVEELFACKFEIGDQLRASTDYTELEIFGFHSDSSREGILCCRWRIGYLREVHIQSHAMGNSASPVKFDWLEKATRPAVSERVTAALTISRGSLGFDNRIGGRKVDSWVPANRELTGLFAKLHPPKSEAEFFLRWGKDDGEGRLKFVEWFRALLAKYQQHQMVIFDPYFEDAGLVLLLLHAVEQTDYVVFTSLPKPARDGRPMRRKSDKSGQARINNLLANCEQNRHLLKRIKLRIYGMKEGRLHDRYVLIMGMDGLPVAGFNLSNSFQKAAENYPLLVTPIPADILLKAEKYKTELVREAEAAKPEGETENLSMRPLFDSATSPMVPRSYEPLRFLDRAQAGDVLSVWIDDKSLKGLSGDRLRERMAVLELLENDSLILPERGALRNFMSQERDNFAQFSATWEVLAEVLAHSPAGDRHFRWLESECGFLQFLAQFLKASFSREYDGVDKALATIDVSFFRERLETLLHRPYHVGHLFHPTKYKPLTWSEYFAIRFLWWYAPDALLAIAETQVANISIASQEPGVVRLALLSQIVSDVSLSIQFDITEMQRDRLIRSEIGLFQWMGLNAIEQQLERPGGLAVVLRLITAFSYLDQVRILGWMVNRAARNLGKAEIYQGLVVALHEMLPAKISADELRHLVGSMLGHMRKLVWAEPWLFHDVVFPLLKKDCADFGDACEIWVHELSASLGSELKHQSRLFDRAREGQTTNITAFLFAYSDPKRQQASLKLMLKILNRQQRIVQQPLASTSNWALWNNALVVSMWILSFTLWCQYYLYERGMTDPELEKLSRAARELAMVRLLSEWRSYNAGPQKELTAFLDQVEELLASSDNLRSE